MFELEAAIENWKQGFGTDGSVGPNESTELEEHLREQIGDLGKLGLNQREAFLVSADRLGYPSELVQEYAKVNVAAKWRQQIFWMLTGYLTMLVFGNIVSAVVSLTGTGLAVSGFGGTAAGVAMTLAMVLVWIALPVLAYQKLKNKSVHSDRISMKWLAAAGAILFVAPIFKLGGRFAQARVVDNAWYGESAIWLGYGGFAIQLCILAVCFVAMYRLSKPAVKNHEYTVS